MNNKSIFLKIDYLLIFLVFALSFIGVTVIGSAVKINTDGITGPYTSQIMWICTGIVLMLVVSVVDYRVICKLYPLIYLLNIILLVLVLLIGREEHNVKRWLFGIQPSEFAKLFSILYVASFIQKVKEKINKPLIVGSLVLTMVFPIILVKAEPSLSASLVLVAILLSELFIGGINWKYITIILLIFVPISIILYIDLLNGEHKILNLFLRDYHIDRLLTLINPDPSDPNYYQTKNSIWAIGSGRLVGKGLYNGTVNRLSYLPESYNDFIFSVLGEEFGFTGCVSVLGIMFFIVLRCIKIAVNTSDELGKLIVGGVATMLAFQAFVNVGVATGLLPNTGMPFPFLSYGGSSMWVNMLSIGFIISVQLHSKPKSMF